MNAKANTTMKSIGSKEFWERRWQAQREELVSTRAENLKLRAALDDLNADVEQILVVASLAGHEVAKSHHIRAQARTIRKYREALRAAGVVLPLPFESVPKVQVSEPFADMFPGTLDALAALTIRKEPRTVVGEVL